MVTEQLLEKIRTALSTDTIMTSWCMETFGRTQKVFLDVNEKDPPDPAADYPAIAVTSIRQRRGDGSRETSWELEFGVGVLQEDVIISGNTITLTGFLQVQILRELAEDALYRSRIADTSSQGESGYLSRYPLFIAGSVIPIKTLKSNRQRLPG